MQQYVKLALPPGVARTGTEYAVQGRYFDSNLVRWFQGSLQPIGGWRAFGSSSVTGKARAMVSWVDNSNTIWAAIGTHSGLFVVTQTAAISDITPSGFTSGREDADFGGGYGSANYGASTYGTPRADVNVINKAAMWTLDVFGQHLVGIMPEDETLYKWELNTSNAAAAISGAPTGNAVICTNDLFVMVLGADGNPRKVQWSDRGDETTWTPSATNLAGDANLQTNGSLVCGKRYQGGEILFTTTDAHLARYVGGTSVYLFEQLASGCGIVSAQAAAVVGPRVFWMSQNTFWQFSGVASPMKCDVQDYVFSNLNKSQVSKVFALHNQEFGEVTWFYPFGESLEPDAYVTYSYLEGHWSIGALSRTAATRSGAFANILMLDDSGSIYEHEIGNDRGGVTGTAKAAPIELGAGDRFMYARQYVPDEGTVGSSEIKFFSRLYPNDTESVYGPIQSANPADLRFSGRQVAWEYRIDSGETARIGVPRIRIIPGGFR